MEIQQLDVTIETRVFKINAAGFTVDNLFAKYDGKTLIVRGLTQIDGDIACISKDYNVEPGFKFRSATLIKNVLRIILVRESIPVLLPITVG